MIARRGTPSAATEASGWRALQPGAYTVAAATYYPNREGDFSLSIDSMALSPPAACVTSLGAVAAGATVTHSGSWARGDGCRSVHATSSQTVRYYADYATFTVPEAGEARIALTSGPQARLYLLDGAGTGGRLLASAGHSRLASNPSIRRVLRPGAYTVETAGRAPRVQADYALSVSVAVSAPTRGDAPAAREIPARRAAAQVDVSGAFNGAVDTYTAASSDTSIVTTSVNGSVVTLNGVAAGAVTVTVTATNAAGSAAQTFAVTVTAAAPRAAGALAAQTLTAGGTATVDVAAAFTGSVDTYRATSSDTAAVTATVNGSALTLTGVAEGRATVTVTAAHSTGRATQTIAVAVEPAAPQATGTLAAQTVTAGASATVDAAGAFSGAVDSYLVTSSNAAVLDVALAGSVVTLTGVAAGTATVTVVAANRSGSAAQTLSVAVNLPPAPTLGGPLASQTLQVTETLAADIAAGFKGRIDTYAATSGDTGTLTVAVDGPEVSLTGVAVGSTTVTVTAINAAGRAARSFNVTVNALTAPQTAGTPLARTISAGAELPIHIADAFTGIVHAYTATSGDTAKLTATADGSTVTLTGVAAGTATVTLAAANAAGRATAAVPVTVTVPEALIVAVDAPPYCLGSEGARAPGGGRRGVGSIDVTYHVTGGAPPYTVTSPDAPGTTRAEPTGTLTIPCSRRGIDLATARPDANVVEAGPRTLTITATDNTGTAAATNVQVEVAEDAYTTEYNGGLMHGGKTYVLGTLDEWVLIKLPQGLTLRFTGLSENDMAHFTEPATGSEIVLDWTTGTEIRRTTPIAGTAGRAGRSGDATPSSDGETTTPATDLLDQLTPAALVPGETFPRNTVNGTDWRPYRGLPEKTSVAIHPKLFDGRPLDVCIDETTTNENLGTDAASAITALTTTIADAVNLWNSKTGRRPFGARATRGFTHDVFEFDSASPTCGGPNSGDVRLIVARGLRCNRKPAAGCAHWEVKGDPPQVTGKRIQINFGSRAKESVVAHELGHFLGLGDYDPVCPTQLTRVGVSSAVIKVDSLMAYASSGCESDTIEARDLDDLSSIYHPSARTGVEIRANVGLGAASYYVYTGDLAHDFNENQVEVAHKYAFFERELTPDSDWSFVGWYDLDSVNGLANESGSIPISYDPWSLVYELTDRPRTEYAIVGVAKGDHKRIDRWPQGMKYSVLRKDGESWSLGTPAVAADPARPGSGTGSSDKDPDRPRTTGGSGGPAAAIKGVPYCLKTGGVQWERRADDSGAWWCDRADEAAVVSTVVRRCAASAGEPRVGAGGVVECVREVPGALRSRPGPPECEAGFAWVPTSRVCSRTESVPASSLTRYACSKGYALVVTVVPFGTPLRQCKKSVPATARWQYVCSEGYSLVRVPLGGQYCRKSVPATATYSCPSRYKRSGTTCYRYLYTNPSGTRCPTGYAIIYNGLFYLCRKKLTIAATVSYSCRSGRLSGSECVFTATPTTETVYSCRSGRLSGSECVFTATPTTETVYSCRSGRLSGSKCISTSAPTSTVTYHCDNAPAGYTISGKRCVKTTTRTATQTTAYYCDRGYTHDTGDNTCSRTITSTPTEITVYGCPSVPPGEPPYRLRTTTTATTAAKTCTRTITIAAERGPPTCPPPPDGQRPYTLTVTDNGDGPRHMCMQPSGDQ